jgi:hypothetical protein
MGTVVMKKYLVSPGARRYTLNPVAPAGNVGNVNVFLLVAVVVGTVM